MESRRDFIKKAALISGGAGLFGMLPASIQKALAINPPEGSTYLDAEHVVILMQENRSFDHSYGTLQGVRGFNDPRAMTLPNGNKVWLQTNAGGQTYLPFRLNIRDTKATWMSALPHSWENQVGALNGGKNDKWLDFKQSGNKDYKHLPLTMGFYDRRDIPFYYSLADAFTICDQNFCSSLTGTTPNRLYMWTGTIREKPDFESKANVVNSDVTYSREASWMTFPERLEDAGISWRIYQNELSLEMGFNDEEESWLANFTNNSIEWFTQYNVWFSTGFHQYLDKAVNTLPAEVEKARTELAAAKASGAPAETLEKELAKKQAELEKVHYYREKYSREQYARLSQRAKNLHEKAFTTNINDPDYHSVTKLDYRDGDTQRTMFIPKGDVLHQFREDVENDRLPTVTWLVAPENFSDHPGAPWYGAWYLSESIDILTRNPEIWKKTIFILCYDENDGYFDHVPPFVPPHPARPESGKVSRGIDTAVEMVNIRHELERKRPDAEKKSVDGPIGLGFRVPLVIASPWSRGGCVNSEVFDHTSIIRFLEHFLSKKTGKTIRETNISEWRRTVCGDLTSTFRPYHGEEIKLPEFVDREPFVESIHQAQFKGLPSDYRLLSPEDIREVNRQATASPLMPRQEKGTRTASPLPYELYADAQTGQDGHSLEVGLAAGNEVFGARSAGAPFKIHAYGKEMQIRNYAVKAGDRLTDVFDDAHFPGGHYHLVILGPNGFARELKGKFGDTPVQASLEYARMPGKKSLSGNVLVRLKNTSGRQVTVSLADASYRTGTITRVLKAGQSAEILVDLSKSFGWYDFTCRVAGNDAFSKRYSGRVETGRSSKTDPVLGQ